jgi:hypothetical protein
VFLIDEIDKMSGGGPSGDPTAAMLEVLDPNQNSTFVDHYLNLPFDLSQVLFICTANNLYDIPGPLRDRMEVIRIAGYTVEEKVEIAWRYTIPQLLKDHGLADTDIVLTDEVLAFVANRYSREAGLRNFGRNLATLMRKRARRKAEGDEAAWVLDTAKVEEALGPPRYAVEEAEKEPEIGAVTGLAWTSTGGDLMVIEALRMPGTGRLTVTGQLGDVMRESVDAALSFARARAATLGVTEKDFKEGDIHIHFPAGAVPKDGPSAGIAITLAIASVVSKRPVRRDLAMTGEVTLRGKVLEIGGVKEKVLAAYRAGLREVLLPKSNEKDLRDVPPEVREGMTFTFVTGMDEVLRLALLPAPVPRADLAPAAVTEPACRRPARRRPGRGRRRAHRRRAPPHARRPRGHHAAARRRRRPRRGALAAPRPHDALTAGPRRPVGVAPCGATPAGRRGRQNSSRSPAPNAGWCRRAPPSKATRLRRSPCAAIPGPSRTRAPTAGTSSRCVACRRAAAAGSARAAADTGSSGRAVGRRTMPRTPVAVWSAPAPSETNGSMRPATGAPSGAKSAASPNCPAEKPASGLGVYAPKRPTAARRASHGARSSAATGHITRPPSPSARTVPPDASRGAAPA